MFEADLLVLCGIAMAGLAVMVGGIVDLVSGDE